MARAASTAGVQTESELDRGVIRLNRINRGVAHTIAAMRRGATLHLTHRPNLTSWQLSNDTAVSNEVARAVIVRGDVTGVGDSLFGRALSQTFRYVEA